MTRNPDNDSSGFTLLELIVVAAIIGILLSLAAPPLSTVLSDPLKQGTRKIVYFLQNARSTAAAEQSFCTISYNRDNRQLSSRLVPNKITAAKDSRVLLQTLSLPESVKIDEIEVLHPVTTDEFTIWIGPQGHTQPFAIHLSDADNSLISIHVEPILLKSNIFDDYTPLVK